MKKILDSKLFACVLTAIICISTTALATTVLTADQINYDENTTVKDKIDDLYIAANRGITFGETLYSTNQDNKVISSRKAQLSLAKGKYIIIMNLGTGWMSNSASASTNTSYGQLNNRTITCTNNNCTIQSLSGYYNQILSSGALNNTVTSVSTTSSAFYVEIGKNGDTINATVTSTNEYNTGVQYASLQAIPIN